MRGATDGLGTGQRTFAAQLNKLRPNLDSITPELEPVPVVVLYMFTVLGIPVSALKSKDKITNDLKIINDTIILQALSCTCRFPRLASIGID